MAEKTREAMLVCEAAGFDVILVETVGVGQSETTVAGMVDAFVLIQLPNAGDDLQAIKKGIVELADIIVDQQGRPRSQGGRAGQAPVRGGAFHAPQCVAALAAAGGHPERGGRRRASTPSGPRSSASAQVMTESGELEAKRQRQAVDWMWTLIDSGLRARFRQHPQVKHSLETISRAVAGGGQTPAAAAYRLAGIPGQHETGRLKIAAMQARHRDRSKRRFQPARLRGPGSKPSRIAEVPHVRYHPPA